MKIILPLFITLFTLNIQAQTISDVDGNIYNTIEIGSQTWMKENLKVVHYQNGDSIGTTYPTSKNIQPESDPKYQWAYNGIDTIANDYGRLYTWHAATDPREVCPVNWHLPSVDEWDTLISFLGGVNNAGTEMVNGEFSALYSGRRHVTGEYTNLHVTTHWWSSDDFSMQSYWKPSLSSLNSSTEAYGNLFLNRSLGFSVRCIMDSMNLSIDNSTSIQNHLIIDNINNKIMVNAENISNPTLYIYNMEGQEIFRKEIEGDSYEINVNHIPNGIYISHLIGKEFSIQKKWMKSN